MHLCFFVFVTAPVLQNFISLLPLVSKWHHDDECKADMQADNP